MNGEERTDNQDDQKNGLPDRHVTEELMDALSRGGPLPPVVQAHLAGCPACREEWETLSQLQHLLLAEAASPPVAPPPALRAELLSRARNLDTPEEATQTRVQTGVTPRSPLTRLVLFPRTGLLPRLVLGAAAVAGGKRHHR